MNEKEAKTKWCPKAVVVIDANGYSAGNRFNDNKALNDQCLCIGSGCMMWEPYEYWVDVNGTWFCSQNGEGSRTPVKGGDCGLKSKDLECRGM